MPLNPTNQPSIPGRVIPKTQKMVLDASLVDSITNYRLRVSEVIHGKE